MRAAIVFNPTKNGVDSLKKAVKVAEVKYGWESSEWIETAADDPGKGQAAEAVKREFDLVIAAGGDGTVRSVAAGMRSSGVPLGLIPLGTGNLLARNLNIPVNDLPGALHIALTGAERPVDVTVVDVVRADNSTDAHVSLVMAGVGIDATMISMTRPELKKRVGWLAYVDAGIRALPASKPFRMQYKIDDQPSHGARVSSILIANLGELPGNIELIPNAVVDDGKLDVAILQPKNMFGWLFIWRRIVWENRILRKSAIGRQYIQILDSRRKGAITYLTGSRVRITMLGEPEEFELDGDEFGPVKEVTFSVDVAGLSVRVAD